MPQIPLGKYSLSSIEILCPVCGCGDIGDANNRKGSCPECGQALSWDWDAIDKKARKSPEYKLAEKYQPAGGPVTTEQLKEWKKREENEKRFNR